MRAGILLSVREKATRLPGKVLKPLGQHATITEHLLCRLREVKRASAVVLATSHDTRDRALCDIADRLRVPSFRGSADDKLRRYRDAAAEFALEFVVVVDGDDPFVSVEHIDRIIERYATDGGDYIVFRGLPVGATGFGLSTEALRRVCAARAESNTEVWGDLFVKNPTFRCKFLEEEDPLYRRPDIRMTLDYAEDYAFSVAVADGLAALGRDLSFRNVMEFLASRPDVAAINQGVQVAYEAHLAKSAAR